MSQLTEKFIDALHRLEETGDVDVIAALFSDDAVLSNPMTIHDQAEAGGAKAFWSGYRGAFSAIESEFINVVENDGVALLEWRSDSTFDGQSVSYSGVSVIESDGDKIKAFRAYFDPRELVAKVGKGEVDATPSDVEAD
jgi:limonene-1,2-epoxide hydrolase